MAENTKIEWATHTFNPWEGCQKVGPGCDHCYAEVRNARFGGGSAPNWGPGAPRRRTSASNWRKPLAWQAEAKRTGARPRVFCASLADVFDNAIDPTWRADLFELIRITPDLDWLLLTKRIGNVAPMVIRDGALAGNGTRYLPDNVWLGATVVNQGEADRDIPKLLATKADFGARVVFLSCEPLLGALDLRNIDAGESVQIDALSGQAWDELGERGNNARLDWVIVGGESGPGARPMHPDWARSLRDQCTAAGVAFHFKQWGEWSPGWLERSTRQGPDIHRSSSGHRYYPVIWPDGSLGAGDHRLNGGLGLSFIAIGKKRAGRLLDGVEHNGLPA